MTGSKCAIAMDQLEDHGALRLDAHIFFTKMQEEKPYIITWIMTQLSLKAELK